MPDEKPELRERIIATVRNPAIFYRGIDGQEDVLLEAILAVAEATMRQAAEYATAYSASGIGKRLYEEADKLKP